MRYAIYYTPLRDDPLMAAGSTWLGRDAFTGERTHAPTGGSMTCEEISRVTAAPRRYGFHATLKAPFALAPDQDEPELLRSLMHFGGSIEPVVIPRLTIASLGPFFALVPAAENAALHQLANDVVVAFERFRAPLCEREIARRNPGSLTVSQLNNLQRWGYPYVFDDFRFHMTLTGPVEAHDRARLRRTLEAFFAPVLEEPVTIANLALFVEPEANAPFQVHSLHPLAVTRRRRSA